MNMPRLGGSKNRSRAIWMASVLMLVAAASADGGKAVTASSPSSGNPTFSDVTPTDWYYTPVVDLVASGVVSGYPDSTFRPNSPTTRAQFTKMLVTALGLDATIPATPTFADVPASSTYYRVVETATARGMASGYACGGPGEPCDAASKPYFRPVALVNRGQAAKMVVEASGWEINSASAPVYGDVSAANPLYDYVNTASAEGVISGYSCGGSHEPCDALSRPYFRTFGISTRAQAAKIIDQSRGRGGARPTATPGLPSATGVPPATGQPTTLPTSTSTPLSATATSTFVVIPPTATAAANPTSSSTSTSTSTNMPTVTPTRTKTNTPSPSRTPSNTNTPTRTPTGQATATLGATVTWTVMPGGSGITANDPIPCPMWPADNIWNRRVDALPTLAASNSYVQTIGANSYLSNGFASRMWQGSSIGNPYNVVPGGQPMVNIAFTDYGSESDPAPYPYPTQAIIGGASYLTPVPSSGDRHVSILRASDCTLYETWHSHPDADGSWTTANGAVFNLLSNQLRPAGWTSADAAGFAILPGLVRYDEVATGQVTHAIRFTADTSSIRNSYVWPARHTDGGATGSQAPPMGTRFRLKASVDISTYPPRLRTILQGLKTYGMFLADSGDPWQIDGAPDQRWDDDELQGLHGILGSDFEAVDESGLMIDPNSGQSR